MATNAHENPFLPITRFLRGVIASGTVFPFYPRNGRLIGQTITLGGLLPAVRR